MGFAIDTKFLDLKVKFDKESKQISVDINANDVNSRLQCDSDKKCEKRSIEYQNYLFVGDYKPDKVKKQY